MKNRNIYSLLLAAVASIGFVACDDEIQPVEEIQFSRVMTPIGLQAFVRTQTTIELNWSPREGVSSYVVEFSEDSLLFSTIIFTDEVTADELPYRHTLSGETRYSARVKSVGSEGIEDSKWAAVTIETAAENIFKTLPGDNVQDTYATLLWNVGGDMTHFLINPGNIERPITAEEKAAGEATITGLTGSTDYTVTLYNGTKRRGTVAFSTQREATVFPENDLAAIIAGAADGAVLILAPGQYNLATVALTKSITIEGQKSYDMPVINGSFTTAVAIGTITLKSVLFNGGGTIAQFFAANAGSDIGTLSIIDCEVKNYQNSFIASTNTTATAGKFGSIVVTGCYVHDILPAGGGDGLDFRGGTVGSLAVENSTFANGFRAFLRMQVASNTSFKYCTFYKISALDNSNNTGMFRAAGVAGPNNKLEVRNCLFAETGVLNPTNVQSGNWTRRADHMIAVPTYANNNIHSCYNLLVGLYTSAAQVSATELNPGFVNAAGGDFTVTNQTLIDNQIGDPRWRQ
jgi:hypothetical protein